jgi:tRNA(fMet)-specific endonuclease VapC
MFLRLKRRLIPSTAELRARLENPIGASDLLIASHALALSLTAVSDNEREFARIGDLRVENWLR